MAKRLRYDLSGEWFKGNTHLHSTVSDGGLGFQDIEALYLKTGHDFLCRTDHRVASDCDGDDFESTILWIDGVELDGKDETGAYYHVVAIGNPIPQPKEMGLEEAIRKNREAGAMLILAHPFWTGNTLEDSTRHGFDGVEIYNNVCHWLNGKGDGMVHWDAMMLENQGILGFASDDAHLRDEHPVANGGWIMVNAAERSRDAILSAIRTGNFYSSCGPEIHSIKQEGDQLSATFSPVQYVRIVGPGFRSKRAPYLPPEETMTEFTFTVDPEAWGHTYLEIVDASGRRAWTNNLFVED